MLIRMCKVPAWKGGLPLWWFAASLLLIACSANAVQAVDVKVQPLAGNAQEGELVELSGERAVVRSGGEEHTFAPRDLLAIEVSSSEETPPPADGVWIELVDGSQLVATSYRVRDGEATIELAERPISLQTRNIRSVRFHPPAEALNEQWNEIVGEDSQGDVIVLRRSETALDQLEGIFHDVTDETVEFQFEDETIPVKRTKLEGMVYYHRAGRELPDSLCSIDETHGTTWQARTLEWKENHFEVVTPAGTSSRVPISSVTRLNFAAGNVVYLSDLDFELIECAPFFGSQIDANRIRQMYAPRRDTGFEGEGLWLKGPQGLTRFDKGLAIHSRSELVFRLTEPYRKLTTLAGLDSRVEGHGNILLVIEGDGRELFRNELSGDDAPIPLELNIEGVRRLRILVDFGQALDVADHLNLCNARIMK